MGVEVGTLGVDHQRQMLNILIARQQSNCETQGRIQALKCFHAMALYLRLRQRGKQSFIGILQIELQRQQQPKTGLSMAVALRSIGLGDRDKQKVLRRLLACANALQRLSCGGQHIHGNSSFFYSFIQPAFQPSSIKSSACSASSSRCGGAPSSAIQNAASTRQPLSSRASATGLARTMTPCSIRFCR